MNDRNKIEAVISELDEKKREALQVTWTKVNADFGSIFSTLLTGTSAKLEPPEVGGCSFTHANAEHHRRANRFQRFNTL